MPANLPSAYPGNAAGYSAYYKALPDSYDMSDVYLEYVGTTSTRDWEENTMLGLVPRSGATKVYASDTGLWSTAANWFPTGVPGVGDKVIIGEGVSVTYDANDTTNLVTWIRVDGNLVWDDNSNTGLHVDTIVNTRTGYLCVGNTSVTISSNVTALIKLNASGAINIASDPAFVGRGILSSGRIDMCGTAKTPFVKCVNQNNAAGITSILVENPTGWLVGDTIVISGDVNNGYAWAGSGLYTRDYGKEDQRTILTISTSANTQISFSTPTTYRHSGYRSDHRCYVANLTRNVRVYSENVSSTYTHRAHTMFMHDNRVNVRYVDFQNLGRTDKGVLFDGPSNNWIINRFSTVSAANSPQVPNGLLASGGIATLPRADKLHLRSVPGSTFTINGTNPYGASITEVVSVAGGFAYTKKMFKTVSSCAPSITLSEMRVDPFGRAFRMIPTPGGTGTQSTVWDRSNDLTSGSDADEYYAVTNTMNVQGRYAIHLHFVGRSPTRNVLNPPKIVGCVVRGAGGGGSVRNTSSWNPMPGWAMVVHQSYGIFKDNVVYDGYGSGIVAEDGNEGGLWDSNFVCGIVGTNEALKGGEADAPMIDLARQGAAMWLTSRSVRTYGNVLCDSKHGFSWNIRSGPGRIEEYQMDQPSAFFWKDSDTIDKAPIPLHKNNVAFAIGETCFEIEKSNSFQMHDVRSIFENFLAWSCGPMGVSYTAHYTYIGFDVHSGWRTDFGSSLAGFYMAANLYDQVLVSCTFTNWKWGVYSQPDDRIAGPGDESIFVGLNRYFIDLQTPGCTNRFEGYNAALDRDITTAELTSSFTASIVMTAQFGGPIDWTDGSGRYWSGSKQDGLGIAPGGYLKDGPPGDGASVQDSPIMYGTEFERLLIERGYYTKSAKKWAFVDNWYSRRTDGLLAKKVIPVELRTEFGYTTSNKVNNGATNFPSGTGPTISDFTVTVTANTAITVDVVSRATHAGGRPMYYGGAFKHVRGAVIDSTHQNRSTFTYVPPPDFTGTETVTYWVDDADANTTAAFATIVVASAPTFASPIANPDVVGSISYGATVTFDVLANDFGGQVKTLLTASVVGGNPIGTATVSANQIVFTASTTFAASNTTTAQITYTMTTTGGSATGQLYVTVNPPPAAAPSATAALPPVVGNVRGGECFSGEIIIANALVNSTDPNNTTLQLGDAIMVLGPLYSGSPSASGSTNARVRTLEFLPTGNILFASPRDFTGEVKIRFAVTNDAVRAGGPQQIDPVYGIMTMFVRGQNPAQAGSSPQIGQGITWNRQGMKSVRAVSKRVSSILADADVVDPVKIAESLIKRFSMSEIQKILDTDDFEMLLNIELERLAEEMERNGNGN
jgi:hypothetical protein